LEGEGRGGEGKREAHSSQPLRRKFSDPLVAACLSSGENPEDSFDDKVGDEPAK